jgi:hypothetical protein
MRIGWQREARHLDATMDHADIRGLGTATDRYVAELPQSRFGDSAPCVPFLTQVFGLPLSRRQRFGERGGATFELTAACRTVNILGTGAPHIGSIYDRSRAFSAYGSGG